MKDENDEMLLTAYALRELPSEQCPAIEARLAEDEEARKYVEEIRLAEAALSDALAHEPLYGLHLRHRHAIESQFAHPLRLTQTRSPWMPHPFWVVAASILIVLGTLAIVLPPLYRQRQLAQKNNAISQGPLLVQVDNALPQENLISGTINSADAQAATAFLSAAQTPFTSFPIEIKTDSYPRIKKMIAEKRLPRPQDVRIEEMVNSFPYDYQPPVGEIPFAAHIEVAQCPWNMEHRLARIGLNCRLPQTGEPLTSVATDVTVEVKFNSAQADQYRLVGFENAPQTELPLTSGPVRPGHAVTALYEIIPQKNSPATQPDDLQLLTVKLRYKSPDGTAGKPMEFSAQDSGEKLEAASEDFKFAAAVAGFGMVLSNSPHKGTTTYQEVLALAQEGVGKDPTGCRKEFVDLVYRARDLQTQ